MEQEESPLYYGSLLARRMWLQIADSLLQGLAMLQELEAWGMRLEPKGRDQSFACLQAAMLVSHIVNPSLHYSCCMPKHRYW